VEISGKKWEIVVSLCKDLRVSGHDGATEVFQGETAITIDDKGRLAIPTNLRDALARECGGRLVIAYNPFDANCCLWIYPYPAWATLRDEVNALDMLDEDNRIFQRRLVGAAAVVEPDGNGRISIPPSLRHSTGMERKAVLLGLGNKFELWNEQAYQAQLSRTLSGAINGTQRPRLSL